MNNSLGPLLGQKINSDEDCHYWFFKTMFFLLKNVREKAGDAPASKTIVNHLREWKKWLQHMSGFPFSLLL